MVDHVIAVDVGGTNIKGAVVASDGTIVQKSRRPTNSHLGPTAAVSAICDFTQQLIHTSRAHGIAPMGIGIAVPGQVDEIAGIARTATNIGWRDAPIAEMLTLTSGLKTVLRHDVRAGAEAEARLGAGRLLPHHIFLPIGTGISCAVMVNGVPFRGDHNEVGEVGHIPVSGSRDWCACGRQGCLETIGSAAAIARRFTAAGGNADRGALAVAEAAALGDIHALAIWQEAITALAEAIVICRTLFDIDHFIVGGGLSLAGDTLFSPLRSAINAWAFEGGRAVVSPAALGDSAGCWGAALAIFDAIGTAVQLNGIGVQ